MSSPDVENQQETPRHRALPGGLLLDRTIVLIALVFILILVILQWHQSQLEDRLVESTAQEEARRYTEALTVFRTLYTREVVETVRHQGIEVSHDYDQGEKKGKAIPLPATLSMKLGNEMGKLELDGQTALYSGYPFPWREQDWIQRDQFAKDAWQALTKDPIKPYQRFEQRNGRSWLRYATADRMRKSCVDCHNKHPQSPKNDWKLGDVRGVLEVSIPLDAAISQAEQNLRESIVYKVAVGGLGLVVLIAVFGQLRRTSWELEQRVKERTSELDVANKALEHSNIELQHFASIASHDLKSPLHGIASFAQFLQKDYQGQLDEKANDYIDRIVQGSKRMGQLINELLAYSAVESQTATFSLTCLNSAFDDVVEILQATIEETGAEVTREALPQVEVDCSQVTELLLNLISNALKYRGDVPPRVHVSASKEDGVWTIAVRDNGIGIAAKNHERAFEVFRRLNPPDKFPGTGIGLALCRRIVRRHGGTIWIESELGEGTTFFFTLPEAASEQHES